MNSRVRNEDELGAVQFQALKNGLKPTYVNFICMRMCHYTANNRKVQPPKAAPRLAPFLCSIQGHLITVFLQRPLS